jgi:hypothetical protein
LIFSKIRSQVLINAFKKEGAYAIEEAKKKKKEKEELEKRKQDALKKKLAEEEQAKNSASITELTDEEADKLQKEIDKKNKQ